VSAKLDYPIPVIGFAAYSGTGKTTLLRRLIPLLRDRGLRVGLIKHAHHSFDVDTPGKDSFELRKSGAERVLLTSSRRWALMVERPEAEQEEPTLAQALAAFPHAELDLLIVEGFKHEALPKIELRRSGNPAPAIAPQDPDVIAVASDQPETLADALPALDLNRPEQVVEFVIAFVGGHRAT
jgi:molybdopterin-guanine dinucleotide biosynthesis protein MobB